MPDGFSLLVPERKSKTNPREECFHKQRDHAFGKLSIWAIGKRTSASLKISDYTENCRCSWQYNEYLDTEMLEDLIVDIAGSSFILPSSGHTGRNGSSMVLDIIFE
ncbi:hypothetical protein EG328_000982 [Venturia inaequalis]|uniref:Uncharacterized protein n=1 Tax=Venturia inaequalis TaxID=5025 RepID=A0A8H3VUL1_VENIN|nr:hypothetical protein EG328_000982 [Venturia inaequalis]KAE9994093.1 hypothetical protein EG327_001491 [Venturia inaequalis]